MAVPSTRCKRGRLAIRLAGRPPFAAANRTNRAAARMGEPSEMSDTNTNETDEPVPVIIERRGPVSWLTLNRPHRLNAVSLPMYGILEEAMRDASLADEVRAIVITGAGRAFCAGADLKAHAESTMTERDRHRYARGAQRANLAIQRSAKPVIAAVHGPAIGGGLELALSCDFIVVASEAKLRLPEFALGTFVGGGVTYTLPERIGMARTKELLMFGDFFTGDHAAAIGLANRAVPAEQVHRVALDMAGELALRAPISMRLGKRLLRRSRRMSRRDAMRAEAKALEACMATEDWIEGARAFAERREPRFTGR
jgi:enoyl-CoA hydratase